LTIIEKSYLSRKQTILPKHH